MNKGLVSIRSIFNRAENHEKRPCVVLSSRFVARNSKLAEYNFNTVSRLIGLVPVTFNTPMGLLARGACFRGNRVAANSVLVSVNKKRKK